MARFITFTFLFVALSVPVLAQTISGLVQSNNSQPAPFAALKLLSAQDSAFVKGTVADEAGRFTFATIPAGRYLVQASFVGLQNAFSPVFIVGSEPVALPSLQLRAADQTLASVTVKARQQAVEQQVDKTVLNVQADATAAGKTAYELLQQAPGVVVDPNDDIQMAGKQGVNVFFDGKPANLSPADLANLLKSTPAANLSTVELITNPSARFDAQGNAGIINIKFKRDKSLGLNGSVTGGYAQSTHSRQNAATDLNYRGKNINVFGNFGWNNGYQQTQIAINRNVRADSLFRRFEQRGYDSDRWNRYTYKAGADYFIGTKQTIGVLVTGNSSANQFGTFSTTEIKNAAGRIDSSLINQNRNPNRDNRFNAALNYRYADTLGLDVTLDADFTHFMNSSLSTITNDYRDATQQPTFRRGNVFNANTDISVYTLKGDLTKVWKVSKTKLEAGFKSTNVRTDNNLNAQLRTESGSLIPDVGRTNNFQYRENVRAVYASLNKEFSKWTVQAGLRAEHSDVKGVSEDLLKRIINRPDTTYVNLFPTAFVQYRATQSSQFGLTYGRRIGRPNYQDLNPFIYQIDPYTSERGNPFLRPTYSHNTELSYTYKWATTLKINYSRTNDYATNITRQEGINGYQTTENVGRADALNLSISSPFQLTKWWSGYGYAGATWTHYQGTLPDGLLNVRAFAFNAYLQHSFTLSKLVSAQLSGFWNAPGKQTIFYNRGLGSLNVSIQKKVLHERGLMTLGVEDLLNTMRWGQSVNFGPQDFNLYRKWESRRVKVQFSYRFGSQQIKAARDRETGEDAGRIKVKTTN